MSTLYIDRRGAEIDAEGDTIVVRSDGERKGTIPIKPLERVVIKGAAKITTRLLAKLSEEGIGLLILGGRTKYPVSAIIGQPGADTSLRIAQSMLQTNEQARSLISRSIVAAKLKSQSEFLRDIERSKGKSTVLNHGIQVLTETLEKLEKERPDRARLRGMEGGAAAAYFPAFASVFPRALSFNKRTRRPPKDPVNACLSLGYTILHFESVREAAAHGLDPMLGIYHDLAHGRESLACDISEPMRSVIDGFVMRLFLNGTLSKDSFGKQKEAVLLNKDARRIYYKTYEEEAPRHREVIKRLVASLVSSVRKASDLSGIPSLPGPR